MSALSLHRICYQISDETKKALHVREFRVRVKSRFVFPMRMNEKYPGSALLLVKIDLNAAELGARRLQDRKQLAAQLLKLPRLSIEANENMEGQRMDSLPLVAYFVASALVLLTIASAAR